MVCLQAPQAVVNRLGERLLGKASAPAPYVTGTIGGPGRPRGLGRQDNLLTTPAFLDPAAQISFGQPLGFRFWGDGVHLCSIDEINPTRQCIFYLFMGVLLGVLLSPGYRA